MKETIKSKEYRTPQFRLVRQDGQNNAFFAASGTPGAPIPTGGGISTMTRNGSKDW